MKLIKKWGIGDIVERDNALPIDGQTKYEHIEALAGTDLDNHISIRRSVRNLVENAENFEEYFQSILHQLTSAHNSKVVLSDTFDHSLNLEPSDLIYIDDKSGRKAFVRMRAGIALMDQEAVIAKPQVSIAEREINKILNLDTWHPITEETNIEYNYENDLYHARIKKKNENGQLITYNFLNGAAEFGDFSTTDGYPNALELIKAISEHNVLGVAFTAGITSLASIHLEPVFEAPIDAAADFYIGFDAEGELTLTEHPTEPYFPLWRLQADTLTEVAPTLTDLRVFYNIQEYDNYWNDGRSYSAGEIVFEDGQVWSAILNTGPGTTPGPIRPSEDENREHWIEAGGGAGTSIVQYDPYDIAYVEGDFKVGMAGALKEGKVQIASKNDNANVIGLFSEDRAGTLLFQKIAILENIHPDTIDANPFSARATLTAVSDASFEVIADEDGTYPGVTGNGLTVAFTDTGVVQASVEITSATATTPGTVLVSATAGMAYDGFAGNDISVAFIDSGSGGYSVSFDGTNILLDAGGGASATATDLANGINTLDDFEASVVTAGDFTLADDNGRLENLSGGSDGLQVSFAASEVTIDFGGLTNITSENIVTAINDLVDFRANVLTAGNFNVVNDILLTATLEGGYDTGAFEVDQPVFLGNNGQLIQDTGRIQKEEYRVFLGYANSPNSIDVQLVEPMLISDNPQYWDSVPLGGAIFRTSTRIRDGFLPADGRELNRDAYSELNSLYQEDGYPHGAGNGTTTFNIPLYEDDAIIIKVRNVSVLTQEETLGIDERLTSLEILENNLGTGAFADTQDYVTMQKVAINRTVGPGGQHATINEAIEFLSSRETEYKSAGVPVTITLLDGFVMQEQVLVTDKDLGWITILSEIGGAPVSIESITQGTQIAGYEQPEISQVTINSYNIGIIQDASVLNGTYFSLQLANGDRHYFWYNTNAFARTNFASVYVRYDVAGSGGNSYNIVVDNDTTTDRALSASLSSTTITINLAVSAGELDDAANAANLVAAEINALTDFSATSLGEMEITGSYNVSFSGGGNASDPALTGQTGNEIVYLTEDTPTQVATKTATIVDGVIGFGATSTDEVITITNDEDGVVEDISKVGNISVTTIQQGRDVSYHVQVNATAHGFVAGNNIVIRKHRSVIEEYNYDGSYEVRTDNLTANSFELVFDNTLNTIYEETRSGIDGEGEMVIPEPVPVSRQAITQQWEFFYYPVFGVSRGTLPTIGCIFEMDSSANVLAGYESYIDGFCATDRGHINFLPGGNAGFINADASGIYGTRTSIINANGATANNSGRHGFWAYANTIINARGGSANDCGWRAPDSPDFGDVARKPGFDIFEKPIGSAVFATRGSLINADGISALNSYGDAIIATYGATINVGEHGSSGPTYTASSIEGSETKTIGGFITGLGVDANITKTNEMEINDGISSENDLTEFKSNIILNKGLYTLAAAKLTWNSATDIYSNHFVDTARIHNRMRRCIITRSGDIRYYLDANDSTLKEDGTAATLDGSHGSVMVEIPKFYVKFSATGISEDREYTWEISDYPAIGYSVHPAFIRNGIEVNYRYISAYDACIWDDSAGAFVSGLNYDNNTSRIDTANDYAASVSGIYPMVGTTRNQSRLLAGNFGTGFSLQDFYLSSAIQLLILLEFGTFNSQSAIGQGNTRYSDWPGSSGTQSDSRANIAGLSNSFGNNTANVSTSGGSTNDFMSYRGIENFFGNVWDWVDGFNINNRQAYVSNIVANFADGTATGYTTLGSVMPAANNYIRDIQNLSFAFLSSSVTGGSDSTYLTDYFFQAEAWRVARLGGHATIGLLAGAWVWSVSSDAASAFRVFGFRSSV